MHRFLCVAAVALAKPGFAGVDIAASGPCRVEPFTGPSAPTV